jgi:hypothetical protein
MTVKYLNSCLILDGVAIVNSYNLAIHANWTTLANNFGNHKLFYNVSYISRNSSLFQSNMTASFVFNQINCTNYVDDFNFNIQALNISSNWITFELNSNGSTTFYNLTVDIIILSQAFRGNIL